MFQTWAIRILGGLAVAAVLTVGTWYKTKEYYQNKCTLTALQSQVKERKRQDEIRKEIMRMSDDELDAAVRGWLY